MSLEFLNSTIKSFVVEADAVSPEIVETVQPRVLNIVRSEIAKALEQTIHKYENGIIYRIPNIELDLGSISLEKLESDLPGRFQAAFDQAIKKVIVSSAETVSSSEIVLEGLMFFLVNGFLPWWINANQFEESIRIGLFDNDSALQAEQKEKLLLCLNKKDAKYRFDELRASQDNNWAQQLLFSPAQQEQVRSVESTLVKTISVLLSNQFYLKGELVPWIEQQVFDYALGCEQHQLDFNISRAVKDVFQKLKYKDHQFNQLLLRAVDSNVSFGISTEQEFEVFNVLVQTARDSRGIENQAQKDALKEAVVEDRIHREKLQQDTPSTENHRSETSPLEEAVQKSDITNKKGTDASVKDPQMSGLSGSQEGGDRIDQNDIDKIHSVDQLSQHQQGSDKSIADNELDAHQVSSEQTIAKRREDKLLSPQTESGEKQHETGIREKISGNDKLLQEVGKVEDLINKQQSDTFLAEKDLTTPDGKHKIVNSEKKEVDIENAIKVEKAIDVFVVNYLVPVVKAHLDDTVSKELHNISSNWQQQCHQRLSLLAEEKLSMVVQKFQKLVADLLTDAGVQSSVISASFLKDYIQECCLGKLNTLEARATSLLKSQLEKASANVAGSVPKIDFSSLRQENRPEAEAPIREMAFFKLYHLAGIEVFNRFFKAPATVLEGYFKNLVIEHKAEIIAFIDLNGGLSENQLLIYRINHDFSPKVSQLFNALFKEKELDLSSELAFPIVLFQHLIIHAEWPLSEELKHGQADLRKELLKINACFQESAVAGFIIKNLRIDQIGFLYRIVDLLPIELAHKFLSLIKANYSEMDNSVRDCVTLEQLEGWIHMTGWVQDVQEKPEQVVLDEHAFAQWRKAKKVVTSVTDSDSTQMSVDKDFPVQMVSKNKQQIVSEPEKGAVAEDVETDVNDNSNPDSLIPDGVKSALGERQVSKDMNTGGQLSDESGILETDVEKRWQTDQQDTSQETFETGEKSLQRDEKGKTDEKVDDSVGVSSPDYPDSIETKKVAEHQTPVDSASKQTLPETTSEQEHDASEQKSRVSEVTESKASASVEMKESDSNSSRERSDRSTEQSVAMETSADTIKPKKLGEDQSTQEAVSQAKPSSSSSSSSSSFSMNDDRQEKGSRHSDKVKEDADFEFWQRVTDTAEAHRREESGGDQSPHSDQLLNAATSSLLVELKKRIENIDQVLSLNHIAKNKWIEVSEKAIAKCLKAAPFETIAFLLELPKSKLAKWLGVIKPELNKDIRKAVDNYRNYFFKLKEEIEQQESQMQMGVGELKEGESIYLTNSGIVLLNPYVKRLFQRLKYTEKDAFVSDEAKEKAVAVLQYLVDGDNDYKEFQLCLHKLFVGLRPNDFIKTGHELSQEDKDLCDGLLDAIIKNWAVLKSTSRDGLRKTFFMREGRLQLEAGGWRLKVEKKPYDVLLAKLPWGYSMVHFPWMELPLLTEWE